MSNKENLIAYLLRNGKDLSWHELAIGFGYPSADAARHAWNAYRNDNPGTPTYVNKPASDSVHTNPWSGTKRAAREQYTMDLEDKVTRFEEDLTKGTAQVEANVGQEIKTLDELIDKCKIDTTKWEITKYIQNFWNNRYQVKAFLAPKQEKNKFQENFIKFLEGYKPPVMGILAKMDMDEKEINRQIDEAGVFSEEKTGLPNGCLIINKQDFHFDKLDVYGDNSIDKRFYNFRNAVDRVVHKTKLSYKITEVIYILGSDAFNCEWTGMTTKGTPQKNMIDYHNGFEAVCNHEIGMLNRLIKDTDASVKIIYIPGNHDEYVGWHLVQALKTLFKDNKRVSFGIDPSYRKYYKFGNSIMMFNHGDVIKPEKLASIFPQEAKEYWSASRYQYIFTGDKHHEKTLDMDGIMFYQLTQGSSATSAWDSKQGYQARGFLTAFVISEDYGIGDVLKERL